MPAAILVPGEEGQGFGTTLNGYAELIETTGMSELELARFLALRLGVRILVDDCTEHPDRWILVAEDGSYGKVITDGDAAEEGDLRIMHATEPIAGAPGLSVVPESNWPQ